MMEMISASPCIPSRALALHFVLSHMHLKKKEGEMVPPFPTQSHTILIHTCFFGGGGGAVENHYEVMVTLSRSPCTSLLFVRYHNDPHLP